MTMPSKTGDSFADMMKRKDELIPKVGFNVVGVDSFEHGAEALYFVGHFETREEAEAEKKRQESENSLDTFHVYDPQTR